MIEWFVQGEGALVFVVLPVIGFAWKEEKIEVMGEGIG